MRLVLVAAVVTEFAVRHYLHIFTRQMATSGSYHCIRLISTQCTSLFHDGLIIASILSWGWGGGGGTKV